MAAIEILPCPIMPGPPVILPPVSMEDLYKRFVWSLPLPTKTDVRTSRLLTTDKSASKDCFSCPLIAKKWLQSIPRSSSPLQTDKPMTRPYRSHRLLKRLGQDGIISVPRCLATPLRLPLDLRDFPLQNLFAFASHCTLEGCPRLAWPCVLYSISSHFRIDCDGYDRVRPRVMIWMGRLNKLLQRLDVPSSRMYARIEDSGLVFPPTYDNADEMPHDSVERCYVVMEWVDRYILIEMQPDMNADMDANLIHVFSKSSAETGGWYFCFLSHDHFCFYTWTGNDQRSWSCSVRPGFATMIGMKMTVPISNASLVLHENAERAKRWERWILGTGLRERYAKCLSQQGHFPLVLYRGMIYRVASPARISNRSGKIDLAADLNLYSIFDYMTRDDEDGEDTFAGLLLYEGLRSIWPSRRRPLSLCNPIYKIICEYADFVFMRLQQVELAEISVIHPCDTCNHENPDPVRAEYRKKNPSKNMHRRLVMNRFTRAVPHTILFLPMILDHISSTRVLSRDALRTFLPATSRKSLVTWMMFFMGLKPDDYSMTASDLPLYGSSTTHLRQLQSGVDVTLDDFFEFYDQSSMEGRDRFNRSIRRGLSLSFVANSYPGYWVIPVDLQSLITPVRPLHGVRSSKAASSIPDFPYGEYRSWVKLPLNDESDESSDDEDEELDGSELPACSDDDNDETDKDQAIIPFPVLSSAVVINRIVTKDSCMGRVLSFLDWFRLIRHQYYRSLESSSFIHSARGETIDHGHGGTCRWLELGHGSMGFFGNHSWISMHGAYGDLAPSGLSSAH